MVSTTEDSVIIEKTKELCQTILDQPEFRSLRENIETFMADDTAKSQYQSVVEKGDLLQQKQQQGLPLSDDEISDFEQQRDHLFGNPIAKGFLDAQDAMHRVQSSVGQYVSKTLELGRVPSPEDFQSGSCGEGCGCH